MALRSLIVLLFVAPASAFAAPEPVVSPEAAAFFEAKVRPVLATHCLSCHGPRKQSAELRLDGRVNLLREGDHGPIVVPGDPDRSVLIQAVRQLGALKMPPKGKLPADAIDALAAWIKMGAPWPADTAAPVAGTDAAAWKKHWAFQPVRRPAVPVVPASDAGYSPVDAFVYARLKEKGLRPSSPADRRTLIRRATFDLIGLPPTPQEVDAFLSDPAPEAFAKVIDRLLASPHYGERWGRHWLDIARYADTKGYVFFEENNFPWAWTYRDYVVRAINDDLPFDRFILEQLAADHLVTSDDRRPLTALGFLTLGGRFMNNVHDIIDDRIDVVTRGLMGLTVSCARCHDHKFDPIPQADYYSLYGIFASSAEPTVPPLFQPAPRTDGYAKFAKELDRREQKLTDFVKQKHADLTAGTRRRVAEYLLAAHALRDRPSTDDFMLIADTNDLNPTMIVRWQKYLDRSRKERDGVFAAWHAYAAVPEQAIGDASASIVAKLAGAGSGAVNPIVARALTQNPPKTMADLAQRYATVLHAVEKKVHGVEDRPLPDAAEEALRQVFFGTDAPANIAFLPYGDLSLLPDRASQGKLQELRKALEQWRATGPDAPPRAMVLEDLATPFQPYIFVRGNPSNKGAAVPRRLPSLFAGERQPLPNDSGRLALGRAIVHPDNPLTVRVLVNRVWQHHFGRGLVDTPSDFGMRSDPPSHPDLLDWLAGRFVADGWSLKKLHRRVMLSRTYQQQSDDRVECRAVDPDNRLLWRMPRQRLDFEATRDALLSVADRLDHTVGGPSVPNALASNATRRTLYGFLDRLNLPGLFRTFDFPSPDATNPQRENTTIAPQALFLMNHPFVIECARNVVRRPEVAAEKDTDRRIERVYRLMFTRAPAPSERQLARSYLGEGVVSPVAWERWVHALLLTNEFVTID